MQVGQRVRSGTLWRNSFVSRTGFAAAFVDAGCVGKGGAEENRSSISLCFG